VKKGLKGVVALESKISRIDGEKGILEYRGYNIHDLVKNSCFEEVVFLLWYGFLPNKKELKEFSEDIKKRRDIPRELVELLNILPKDIRPIVVLRTLISYLGSLDKDLYNILPEQTLEKSKNLLAKIPTIVAYYHRIRQGKSLIKPNKNLTHAGNFLWMLKGKRPSELEEKALDADLIMHAEHGLNASTFAGRVCASTFSDIYAGVVTATGVLTGPLHGGASEAVIKMFRKLKGENNLSAWVKEKFEKKERIPGFGHRVYKGLDPRAKELRKLARKLAKTGKEEWLISLSDNLVKEVRRYKELWPNVDYYAATLYPNLGIPDDLFIDVFAMGRIAGWCAHLREQYKENKLIRPLQKYIGEKNKKYIPIKKRKNEV